MAVPLRSPRFTQIPTRDRFAKALKNTPTIKKGESDREAVRLLQQALVDLGMRMTKSLEEFGSPDGLFGDETHDAVKEFQRRQFPGQTPDGKVGHDTLSRLDDLLPMAGAPLPDLKDLGEKDVEDIGRDTVLSILRGNYVKQIYFKYKGQEVTWGWFWMVKQLIDQGKIGVHHDPIVGDVGLAVYNPDNNAGSSANKIVIPKIRLTTWKHRSVLLHECVHAIQDIQGNSMNRLASEAAAYIAQNIYHRLATGQHVNDTHVLARAIHEKANPLAAQAIATRYPTFSVAEMDDLEQAIRNAGYGPVTVLFDGV
jgi:hypothetical protein